MRKSNFRYSRVRMLPRRILALVASLFLAFAMLATADADGETGSAGEMPATPQRIIVFPLFAEEMLLEMIGPDRIVYVGHSYFENGEVYTPTMELTRDIPGSLWWNEGEEELLALKPDLVIMSQFDFKYYEQIYPELVAAGVPFLFLQTPESVEDISNTLAILGYAVGALDTATRMDREMKVELAQIAETVAVIPEEERVRAVFYEYQECGYNTARFDQNNTFIMVANAAGVINAGPVSTEFLALDSFPLAAWNPELVVIDPVSYDTDGSIYEISDRYLQSQLDWLLNAPEFAAVTAMQNRNVYPLRLSESQFIVESVQELARLAYPDLFPEDNP